MAACVLYAAIVLTITAIWVYVGRSWSFSFLAQAMYFPSVLSLLFVDNYFNFITTILGIKEVSHFLSYLFNICYVFIYVVCYSVLPLVLMFTYNGINQIKV
jgi:hypothetical protein